jgi:Fe2+ transport system protein FeoA
MQATATTFALDKLHSGDTARVVSVEDGSCCCQLRCLGVQPGANLELVRTLSGGKLLILRVDGADVALRREVATTIQVAPEATR